MDYYSFLQITLNTLFLVAICPHLFRAGKDSIIQASKWKIHQVLCIATGVLNAITDISNLRSAAQKHVDEPKEFFNFCWTVVAIQLHFVLYYTLWTKVEYFENSIRICQAIWSRDIKTSKVYLVRKAAICFCVFNVLISFLVSLTKLGSLHKSVPWTLENVIKSHIQAGRHKFFLASNRTLTAYDLQRFRTARGDYLLGSANLFMNFHSILISHFIEVVLLSAVVMLWTATYQFHQRYVTKRPIDWNKYIGDTRTSAERHATHDPNGKPVNRKKKRNRCQSNQVTRMPNVDSVEPCTSLLVNTTTIQITEEEGFEKMESEYNMIRALSDNLNKAFGDLTFFYILETTIYYSTSFKSLVSTLSWTQTPFVLYYLICCCSIFGSAADICRRIDDFKCWLGTQQRLTQQYPKEKVQWLFQEINCRIIGLSGMGWFLVGADIIFLVVSTVMAYFLLIIKDVENG